MAEVTKATVCTIFNVNEYDLKNYDIIGIGSGIAYGKHYSRLIETADRLNLRGKRVFVFSTSGTGSPKFNSA
jgi:menaquinone-dependent protoporphyrinogen IX oxidase